MTGTNWTALGSQGSGDDQFDLPHAVVVSVGGRIYVADTNNNRIVRVTDISGSDWFTFGSFGDGTFEMEAPKGIFVR